MRLKNCMTRYAIFQIKSFGTLTSTLLSDQVTAYSELLDTIVYNFYGETSFSAFKLKNKSNLFQARIYQDKVDINPNTKANILPIISINTCADELNTFAQRCKIPSMPTGMILVPGPTLQFKTCNPVLAGTTSIGTLNI